MRERGPVGSRKEGVGGRQAGRRRVGGEEEGGEKRAKGRNNEKQISDYLN
jgi:hypothetical protein